MFRAIGAMENLSHPPILAALDSKHGLVLHNHQLARLDVQKDRPVAIYSGRLSRLNR